MSIEEKLDKIINILYDDKQLLWKKIPITDIVILGKDKYEIDWSASDINFILSTLINDGYVAKDIELDTTTKVPTYSLTTKGIQLKHKGGFVRTKWIENLKQWIILWAAIVTLIASSIAICNFIKKTWGKPIDCKCNQK